MFSVIIPLYNKIQFIERAIESVLAQSYKIFEIIVVNDGSTDEGEKKVKEKYHSRVKLINQENKGVSAARNTGISNSKYQYIAFLDADDLWHPEYLSSAWYAINSKSNPGILGTSYTKFKNIKEVNLLKNNLKKNPIQEVHTYSTKEFFNHSLLNTLTFTSAIIIKKDFFEKNLGFDQKIKFGEDLDVWFRAILFFGQIVFIPAPLVFYSKEDPDAATKRIYHLNSTLLPKIINDKYFQIENIKEIDALEAFKTFRVKWVFLRLHPLFLSKDNEIPLKELMSKLPKKYLFASGIYFMPFWIGNTFFKNRILRKYFVRNLVFCFSHFYKS